VWVLAWAFWGERPGDAIGNARALCDALLLGDEQNTGLEIAAMRLGAGALPVRSDGFCVAQIGRAQFLRPWPGATRSPLLFFLSPMTRA
jgi:hypothetical protein